MSTRIISTLFLCLLGACGLRAQSYSVSLHIPDSVLLRPEVKLASEDVTALLRRACDCPVAVNPVLDGNVVLVVQPGPAEGRRAPKPYPVIDVPEHGYRWQTTAADDRTVHTLQSPSPFGIACGLYGLLQEALGFSFYHPRETYIPSLAGGWPLGKDFSSEVYPKFPKKGFHLHTMHPIELAEPLFNPQLPGALDEVKQYIDWLARNEQNVFDFCLMESVDRDTWIPHAAAFTDYARQRGILTSIDVSLHMIQQKSFQLYRNPPYSFRSKKEQIRRNLDWLYGAHWDIVNMEFNSAEFLTGNAEKRNALRKFVQTETERRGAKLMGRQHVVKESNDLVKSRTDGAQHRAVDSSRGVMAHTVMCYSMTEPHAPVYENENQRHVFEFMLRENKIRETWYYPESAYWVTFDNSVPVYPLPYLSTRLADIDTAAAYGVEGHLTFSSGWELGYWLFDWSIARWSRRVSLNGQPVKNTPTQYAYGKPFAEGTGPVLDSLLVLHEKYLKEKNLMAYMTAQTVTDEIPRAFRREFHPRPPFTYGWLRNKSDAGTRDSVERSVIGPLREFSARSLPFSNRLLHAPQADGTGVEHELGTVLDITQKRAYHRSLTLAYLLSVRRHREMHIPKAPEYLREAQNIRTDAQKLLCPPRFRYDVTRLTGRFPNGTAYTAYDFGYLYPAYSLHFWEREERQAKKNRYDFLFMNIWEVFRIIGLQD